MKGLAPEIAALFADSGFCEGRVIQDGQPVAGVSGMPAMVRRELRHYAAVYEQDGPVRLEIKRGGRWREWSGQ